jgi:hypothetical protein
MTTQDFYNELLNDGKQLQSARRTSTVPISTDYDRVHELISLLRQSGVDITNGYNEWLKVGFAIAGAFGESGRDFFHNISSLYSEYDVQETDKKYDECLRSENGRTDISTLFYLAKEAGVSLPKREYKSLQVTKGHSDKNVPVSLSIDEGEEGMPRLPLFPSSVYKNLPDLLNNAISKLSIPQEKDLVLVGSIVTLSACILPVQTRYFGKTIYPNIYLFVPGPAGAGKGRLDFCFRLVKPIHKAKLDRWLAAKEEYRKEYARYKRQRKGENIDPPTKPPIELLRIPANSSATSFAQAMADNGNLLLFETEGDTVVNTFNSDFGNYSDSFRKAFAHESFGYLRRGDDGEEKEIETPRLSTVLSGTPEQVKSLIKDAENGLLSRFMFYCINSTDEWLDGFDGYSYDTSLEEEFDSLGKRFEAFTQVLNQHPQIMFRLSMVQQQKFNDYFKSEKDRMHELNGDLYSASSHRLAWCFLRVAMVLTTLRIMDTGRIDNTVECADVDFETTLDIIKVISYHNDYIFNVLNKERPEGIAVADSYSAATRNFILDALPGQFSTDNMKEVALKINKSLRTVRRQIKRAIESGKVQMIRSGEYKKLY